MNAGIWLPMFAVFAPAAAADPPALGIVVPREVLEVGQTVTARSVPAGAGSWGVVHDDVLRVDAAGHVTALRRGGTYVTLQAPDGSGVAVYVRVVRPGESAGRRDWEAPPGTVHDQPWFTAPAPEGASGPYGAPLGWEDPTPLGVWVDDFITWRVVTATGPLSATDADRILAEERGLLQHCYRTSVGPGGVGTDHGTLALVVGADGRPQQVVWSEVTRPDPKFRACLDRVVPSLTFAPSASGTQLQIAADFVLKP